MVFLPPGVTSPLHLGVFLNLLFCFVASSANVNADVNAARSEAGQSVDFGLADWLNKQTPNGYFNPKQEILKIPESTITIPQVGVFATEPISKGEVLATIPWNLLITPKSHDPKKGQEEEEDHPGESDINCNTAWNLARKLMALKDGYDNDNLYLNYLLALPNHQLVSTWSDEGKQLFLQVLGLDDNPPEILLEYATTHVEYDWYVLCRGELDNELAEDAAMLVLQRATPQGYMVPLFDFYTHRNGDKWQNTHTSFEEGKSFQILASRGVEVGEQLHGSYTECPDCHREKNHFTPEIFRDHGIIELFPQTWGIPEGKIEVEKEEEDEFGNKDVMAHQFLGQDIIFTLDKDEQGNIQVKLHSNIDVKLQYDHIPSVFRRLLRILYRMKNIEYAQELETNQNLKMPQQEWNAIWDFHQAYSTALKHAIVAVEESLVRQKKENNPTSLHVDNDYTTFSTNTRSFVDQWIDHYDHFTDDLDSTSYNDQTCESSELVDFMLYYQEYELQRSNYQELLWQVDEEENASDMCLHLDDILQICTSYRPHYHEFFVHFPARYVPDVKRVVFLGSGDAMLLHEILKYPNLEKVVGLELDQMVTRKSFQQFQTQPHYDDDRVEWWYGDATKTLPLLPRDYWGSFDLLLVDLSETVVSLHVTGRHDILDVIAMLLKPEGVMLENELYIDKLSRHFDHTVHLFYGSPKVCTQVLTVSSNSADFLRSPLYDHGVDSYLLDPVDNDEESSFDRYRWIHDYVWTNARDQGICGTHGTDKNITTTEHGRKAGILHIVEAEATSVTLDDVSSIEEAIYTVLLEQGLTPVTTPANEQEGHKDIIFVVMKEGYVVARLWPVFKYVGFDIHLWGAYEKLPNLRPALAHVVQSSSLSSYRIVVGGMQGTNTWEADQNQIGVQISQKRDCQAPDLSDKAQMLDNQETILGVALTEFVELLAATGLVVAVACGFENDEDGDDEDINTCAGAIKVLAEHANVKMVVPMWACDELETMDENTPTDIYFANMFNCERSINAAIDEMDSEIDLFVVDESVPLGMLQIWSSLLSAPSNRDEWWNAQYAIVVPYHKGERDRRRFLDAYRKLWHETIMSVAEFQFKGSEAHTYLSFKVLVNGDNEVVRTFMEAEESLIQDLTDFTVKLRLMEGGRLHNPQDMLSEQQHFLTDAYDSMPNENQNAEQRALGRQTIYQLDLVSSQGGDGGNATPLTLEELESWFKQTLATMEYTPTTRWNKISSEIGADGAMIISKFAQGSALLIWDGQGHVDINLFCSDQRKELADSFVNSFVDLSGKRLAVSLRDDQPRGIGRVVNFSSDMIKKKKIPANNKADSSRWKSEPIPQTTQSI